MTSAWAQVTPSGKGYLFRAKYIVGHRATYSVKSGGDMQGLKVSLTMSLSERILSSKGGIGTIAISTGKSEIRRDHLP